MNPIVKNYREMNPSTLIGYVRNAQGFVKGVVVATSKNNIGWSLVNGGERDSDWKLRKVHQLPTFQKLGNAIDNLAIYLDSIPDETLRYEAKNRILSAIDFHQGLVGLETSVKIPVGFDKDVGFLHAVSKAVEGSVRFDKVTDEISGREVEVLHGVANDKDLIAAVWKMRERATKYYRS